MCRTRVTTPHRFAYIVALGVLLGQSVTYSQQTRIKQSPPRDASKIKPPSARALPGPVIPGLRQGAIPQGITFASDHEKVLISHYFEKAPACISVLDSAGRMTSCVTLQEPSGQLHHGHVGGIAVSKDTLFVASNGSILQYTLSDFVSRRPSSTARASVAHRCETKASFCTATADLLLVGEFAYGKKYPTKSSHHLKDRKGGRKYAWVCGYDINKPADKPTCVLSVRQKVQGMHVSGDRVFLSISYGRANRSLVVVYRSPIGEEAHAMATLDSGDKVPLWFLDGENYLGQIDFPPMAEGLVMIGEQLAVLSESGAQKYQSGGKGPLDRIVLLDVSRFR